MFSAIRAVVNYSSAQADNGRIKMGREHSKKCAPIHPPTQRTRQAGLCGDMSDFEPEGHRAIVGQRYFHVRTKATAGGGYLQRRLLQKIAV